MLLPPQETVAVDADGAIHAVISKEKLEASVGNAGKVRLAILGQVFDVTKGRRHYGKDGGYSFFAGKDASRAYVTGASLSPHCTACFHDKMRLCPFFSR